MAELRLDNLFDKAMDATVKGIKSHGFSTSAPWPHLIPRLKKVVGKNFEPSEHSALEDLRRHVKKSGKEGQFLADGASAATTGSGLATDAEVARCSCLKLLRHTYYHARRANHKMWIVSLPESYSQWPHKYFKCTHEQLLDRLDEGNERFSRTQRNHISDATQRGLHWIHKAQIVLDDLDSKGRAMRLLKRWFADEDTTEQQLRAFARGKFKAGLRKMAPKMSAGHLIVTDFVPIRFSADPDDSKAAGANAFVTEDKRNVIYIEKPFFHHSATSVFQKDERHWARIMVHEMSHREGKTDDKRYGWKGIRPKKGVFASADAMQNADSWALFCANAAGAMSPTDVARSLDGTSP
jgi:hypothetical protein